MLQKYYSIFVIFAGSCLLSIVNSAPVNCKAFDAARWRMINLKLCQTAQSLTHRSGGWGSGGERERKSVREQQSDIFGIHKNCNRLMPAT